MKKLILALTAMATFGGSALAADLPARTYTKAPAMPEPVANWTGFYVFGGVGSGFWDADVFDSDHFTGTCVGCAGHSKMGGDGYFGTVGAGYDWQFDRTWVAGVFADGQFGNLKGTIHSNNADTFGQEKLRDTWAVGVRAGYLVAPNVLSYVNGGYTGSHWSGTSLQDSFSVQATEFTTPSFSRNGFFVGGGVENNLDIFGITAPGWFMKTEYRAAFYSGGPLTNSIPGAPFGPGAFVIIGNGLFFNPSSDINFKPAVQTISTSLVYRFNSGGSALAADLPTRAYTKAPAMASNWTGFYMSGGAGGGFWDADTFESDPFTGNCVICSHQKMGGDGWFGTVGAGYDWQFNRSWVAGIFADGQFGNLKGTIQDLNDKLTGDEKLRDTWAVGVRAGYLVAPNVLSYVNGGYTGSNWSGTSLLNATNLTATPSVTPSFNRTGFFVGGGVENDLNLFGIRAPGWFMKTEYRAAFYSGIDLSDTVPGAPSGPGVLVPVPGLGSVFNPNSTIHFKPQVQTISTSLVYRFNSPVVAKY
jgi:outer membrane immunogenic protein